MLTIKRFGKLVDGEVKYKVAPFIITTDKENKTGLKLNRKITIYNPTEAQLNEAGWYRVNDIYEDGETAVVDNVLNIYHGKPEEVETNEVETNEVAID